MSKITLNYRYPKLTQLFYLWLCLLLLINVSACSNEESPISDDQQESGYDAVVEPDQAADQPPELVHEEVFLHGFRPGKLQVEFEFSQSGGLEEVYDDDISKINWNSRIVATLEQQVAVLQDLRKHVPINPNASAEELLDAFGNGAYIELDQYPKPQVSGQISFENYSLFTRPGSNGAERLEEIYRGSGEIDYLDLSNFEISRYGHGYSFDLNLAGPMTTTLIRQSDQESSPRENVTESEEYTGKFEFHPKADRAVYELYPYAEEYADLPPELEQGNMEIQEQLFDYFNQLDSINEEMLMNEFSPAITEVSRDKLVVTYSHNGRAIAPPFASMNAVAAPPKVNKLRVVVTITAD